MEDEVLDEVRQAALARPAFGEKAPVTRMNRPTPGSFPLRGRMA
jgi:hypothetical protein